MKKITILMSLLFTLNIFAAESYSIQKGSLHRGGWITVDANIDGDNANINIKYKVNPKRFIPGFFKEYLQGDHTEVLPKEFLFEEAYLDLEESGSLKLKDAEVFHLGRVTMGRYTNCHKVKILAKNGKSQIIAYYHPQVKEAGWVHIDLTILKIPVVKTYNLKATVKN